MKNISISNLKILKIYFTNIFSKLFFSTKKNFFLTGFFLFVIYVIRAFECNQPEHQPSNITGRAGPIAEIRRPDQFREIGQSEMEP